MAFRTKRVALVTGMVLASLNVWTGAPLLGLWIGSRVTGGSQVTMLAVFVMTVAMLALCFGMIRILAALSARHDALTGRQPTVRRHTPWLRSMSGEREHDVATGTAQLTAVEYIAVGMVALAVVVFEIWFFFFSGSPLGPGSGRD